MFCAASLVPLSSAIAPDFDYICKSALHPPPVLHPSTSRPRGISTQHRGTDSNVQSLAFVVAPVVVRHSDCATGLSEIYMVVSKYIMVLNLSVISESSIVEKYVFHFPVLPFS